MTRENEVDINLKNRQTDSDSYMSRQTNSNSGTIWLVQKQKFNLFLCKGYWVIHNTVNVNISLEYLSIHLVFSYLQHK